MFREGIIEWSKLVNNSINVGERKTSRSSNGIVTINLIEII